MIVHRSQNFVLSWMNLLRLNGLPVLQQLQIEERLLRTSTENWCIINDGTPLPTIVMGISGKNALPDLQPYPRPIMFWSSVLYNRVFHGMGDFHLRENDYVFGDRKFGGNVQSITKNRWIHHTSFLWDYEVRNMSYLKHPKRAPEYRLGRNHLDFICRLKEYMPRLSFIEKTVEAAGSEFSLKPVLLEDIDSYSKVEFSPTSKLLSEQELEAALLEFER